MEFFSYEMEVLQSRDVPFIGKLIDLTVINIDGQ